MQIQGNDSEPTKETLKKREEQVEYIRIGVEWGETIVDSFVHRLYLPQTHRLQSMVSGKKKRHFGPIIIPRHRYGLSSEPKKKKRTKEGKK